LWCLPHQNVPPLAVMEDDRKAYASRFTSEDQVQTSVHNSLNNNFGHIAAAADCLASLKATFSPNSKISVNLGRIPEPLLLYAFRVVASFGLPHWALDVLSQDPDSMYNLLHEYIALNTFEQVAAGHGYLHMGINLAVVHDFALMRKFY
ncbi:hypothetical protein CPB84DRAFT_1693091, partial [Gymnopilus junonius]